MPEVNLPPDVVRVLSFHGPVEVVAHGAEPRPMERAAVAPFDDSAVLFLRPEGAVQDALGWNVQLEVQARHPDGDYALRMVGRAHPGVRASRARDRHSLEPWLPDGRGPSQVLATRFIPEFIEFVRTEADDKVRYHGPTPAGRNALSMQQRWVRTGASGSAGFGVFTAFVIPFVWLGYLGADYPVRPLAAIIAILSAEAWVFGLRFLVVYFAYITWRAGRLALKESSLVGQGLIPARMCVRVGLALIAFALAGTGVAWAVWDAQLASVTFGSSLVWILAPSWAVHIATSGAGKWRTE
ncbi:MAG TPA: hypothetical protein DFR83_04210 [Deltaproteobacteria bacterium]|nr:hypothetical protein [Deltaproteobacteria bacterium]